MNRDIKRRSIGCGKDFVPMCDEYDVVGCALFFDDDRIFIA